MRGPPVVDFFLPNNIAHSTYDIPKLSNTFFIPYEGKCLEKFFKTSCIYGRRKPKGQILIYLLFAFQFQQIQSNISKKFRFLFFH